MKRQQLRHQTMKLVVLLTLATATLASSLVFQKQQSTSQIKHLLLVPPDEQFVSFYEHKTPLKCVGIEGTIDGNKLAPGSEIVQIQFGSASFLNANSNSPMDQKQQIELGATNKSKQSQEFDVSSSSYQQQVTTSTTTEQPHHQTSPSSQTSESSSQNSYTTTTSTSTIAPNPPTPGEEEPAGSHTTREGDDICCGEANPSGKSNRRINLDRIVGGHKSEPGEFPFQVRLNIRSRRGSGICGGVVYDDRHILTAAHCMTACVSHQLTTATIETSEVKVTIGDHAIKSNDGEIELDVDQIVPHEKYDACNFYANDHDIALIKTQTPINFRFTSDGYGSVNRPCMPTSRNITYREGEQVIVSGWGVTRENSGALSNILRYVQVPLVNVTKCQDTYGPRVTNEHVCAGFQAGGKDSCQGDSGGPLVRVMDNRYELVGIVSFGYGCGQPSAPGVYTRVASYIDWIQNNL